MTRKITRREFVQTTAAAAAALTIVPVAGCAGSSYDPRGLPTVKLGSTGAMVPVLGFGCGSRWMSIQDDDKALEILEYALAQGLYYWDSAANYGNDQISSEERVGRILKNHREKVFMVSKTGDRGAEEAKMSVERSLERLQTDYLDLLHVHAIASVEDAENLGEKGKVYEVLEKYRSEGVIRNIGFSGHASAEGMKRAAELYDFDVMMMALNHHSRDGSQNFEELPAPFAMKKGMGVVAMKAIRPRESVDGLAASDLMKYALSLKDFHMVNVGISSMEALKANLEILQDFEPLEAQKMEEISLALQPFHRGRNVAWMEPSYVDGWKQGIHLA